MRSLIRSRRRPVQCEVLERRDLLAGDVTVAVINGNLFLEGDVEGNQISVTSGEEPGQVYVGGISTNSGDVTTVNGLTGRVLFEGVRNHVIASLGGGNDSIHLHRLRVEGNLMTRTGDGNDRVVVGLPGDATQPVPSGVFVRGSFQLDMGNGDDVLVAHRFAVVGNHHVGMGSGDDTVRIGRPPTSNVAEPPALRVEGDSLIELGDGDDEMTVHGALVGMTWGASGGEGNDVIRVNRLHAMHVRIRSGGGNDLVSLEHIQARSLAVAAGDGNDRVHIVGAALSELVVDLGAGDDTLAIGQTVVDGNVLLNGGDGTDTLIRLGGNRWRNVIIRGFENGGNSNAPENELPGGPTRLALI